MTSGPSPAAGDSPARGLDAAEQLAWRTFVDATRGLLDVVEKQLQTDFGMPLAYYEVLLALAETPDRVLRMGELARRLRSSPSRLSHAISRLEAASLVRREHLHADRRGAVAILTDAGAGALAAATPAHDAAVRRHLLDTLTAEQVAQLTEIGRAIQRAHPLPPVPRRRTEDRDPLPRPRPAPA